MAVIPRQPTGSASSHDAVPLINRRETILGVGISFQIVAWAAVLFRIYARIKLARAAGWDDVMVVLAVIAATVGASCVLEMLDKGLGQHVLSISLGTYQQYIHWFWAATISYFCATTIIKISLLLQYLRLFEKRSRSHYAIIGLTVVVSLWGLAFSLMLAFACTPVKKFWDFTVPGKCFGFGAGSSDPHTFFVAFAAHSATNMALDMIIFAFPIFSLSGLDLEGRRKYAIASLAALGAVVVVISIARLASISETRAGTYPAIDPTWLAPTSLILSCLEVDIAVLCASIPIFWPLLSSLTFGKIFVVDEVIVRTEVRESHRPDTSGSETELRAYQSDPCGWRAADVSKHYKDPFVVDHVRPITTDDDGVHSHSVNVEHTQVPLSQIERLMH